MLDPASRQNHHASAVYNVPIYTPTSAPRAQVLSVCCPYLVGLDRVIPKVIQAKLSGVNIEGQAECDAWNGHNSESETLPISFVSHDAVILDLAL